MGFQELYRLNPVIPQKRIQRFFVQLSRPLDGLAYVLRLLRGIARCGRSPKPPDSGHSREGGQLRRPTRSEVSAGLPKAS